MKVSFGVKFGALLLLANMTLVSVILVFFYDNRMSNMKSDLSARFGDVARTSAFVLKEEDRVLIETFRNRIYDLLPKGYENTVDGLSPKLVSPQDRQVSLGPLLDSELSSAIESDFEFQYIVQLLRRMQAGSKKQADKLSFLEAEQLDQFGASRVSAAQLMVLVPGVDANTALMVLADSNYKSGNPTSLGTLYSSNAFQAAPFGGRLSVSDDWYEGVQGKEMSALVPILNNDGAVIAALCLDWRVDDFSRRIDEQKQVSLLIFSIAIVVALLLSFLLTSWVSIPLSKLRLGAEQLSKRDFKHEVSINSQDEFGLLAATFNKVSSELDEFTRNMDGIVEAKTVQLTKAKEELVAVNSILNQENVHLGAEVSNLIALRERALPYLDTAEQRAALKDYHIELHYLPSQALCGDLWQTQVDERGANITLGQVSGYGLETAMMAMQVQSLLKEISASGSHSLASINHYLFDQNESINLNLLCKVMSVQIENNTLSVVGSGESPIKFGNEPSRLIDVPTMLPLGVKSSVDVDPVCLSLEQGEGIFLFSAGFKLALAKLHDIDADTLEPSNIIKLSEILDNNGVTLLEKIKSQDWFDDFQQDISFILIRYQGNE